MTALDIILTGALFVLACWYRWDKAAWDRERASLLDRIQAQNPGALAELTNRELVIEEQKRVEQPPPRMWRPPEADEEEETSQMVEIRARAASGDARFL